jgi:hypothetical protein
MLRKLLYILSIAAAASGLASHKAHAQTTCFRCEDWEAEDGWWKHEDARLFANDLHNEYHPSPVYGSCNIPGHWWYCNGCFAFAPGLLERAAKNGQTATLIRALLETEGARLNIERSALQILGVGDQIRVHVPLNPTQLSQVQLALVAKTQHREGNLLRSIPSVFSQGVGTASSVGVLLF